MFPPTEAIEPERANIGGGQSEASATTATNQFARPDL